MNTEITEKLIKTAIEMRKKAYAKYSKYTVGAALLTSDDQIYTGCNIENAAFTPTVCAERVSFFKAISEGKSKFKAIAISAGKGKQASEDYPSPCGVCRQVMAEFCNPDKFIIILVKNPKDYKVYTLSELLPDCFTPERLG